MTFWAAVPHYVSQPPIPRPPWLLRRVEDVLDIEVPLGDLPAQAEEWEQAVTEMTAEDEEIAEYVAGLEAPRRRRDRRQRGDVEGRRRQPGRGIRTLSAPPGPLAGRSGGHGRGEPGLRSRACDNVLA